MIDEDGDWLEGLSPGARKLVDSVDLRHHKVELERVQRIHLGLDGEPMPFDAATIADMLQEVADRCDEDEAFTLRAVVNALRGEDDNHVLVLKRKMRGRYIPPDEHEAAHNRRDMWLAWLAHLEKSGMKTEAAVAAIAENQKVSRATVFSEIRAAEVFLDQGRKLIGGENFDNPRPAKSPKP